MAPLTERPQGVSAEHQAMAFMLGAVGWLALGTAHAADFGLLQTTDREYLVQHIPLSPHATRATSDPTPGGRGGLISRKRSSGWWWAPGLAIS
jgi:hypothetical protein